MKYIDLLPILPILKELFVLCFLFPSYGHGQYFQEDVRVIIFPL